MKDIKTIKGIKDIIYPESAEWKRIIDITEGIFESYGYRKIFLPVIEYTELFSRSIGQDTDIVSKEMYSFKDRKGRDLSLRPEGTAGVVRAMIENKLLQGNIREKVYYFGPMFRYENPQAGRYRQFYQLGCEVFGSDSPSIDAEIIEVAVKILKKCGVMEFKIKYNSVGCEDCRKQYREAVKAFLLDKTNRLCNDCRRRMNTNTLRILDCKNEKCKEVYKELPAIKLCDSCSEHMRKYEEDLKLRNIGTAEKTMNEKNIKSDKRMATESLIRDDRLVRGLDYYTGIVFEVDIEGHGTVIAGGRYDTLVKQLGGPDVPACGWALGLERLWLSSSAINHRYVPEVYIALLDGGDRLVDMPKVVNALREKGISVDEDFEDAPIGKKMKIADKKKVKWVLIFGEKEAENKTVSIKNLESGEQESVPVDNIEEIKKKIQ